MEKVKIVLDADVLIHFSKGERLSTLPSILPEFDHIVLDYVRDELRGEVRHQVDMMEATLKNITVVEFAPEGEMLNEYISLRAERGKGESACMAYCRHTHNVIGSSNLKDIKDYCAQHQIAYLTTTDFLFYAYNRKLMTASECTEFVNLVISKRSKVPQVDITTYTPNTQL